MIHEVVHTAPDDLGVTLTCECGKTFRHPKHAGAERLHAYHAGVEQARTALRGGRA